MPVCLMLHEPCLVDQAWVCHVSGVSCESCASSCAPCSVCNMPWVICHVGDVALSYAPCAVCRVPRIMSLCAICHVSFVVCREPGFIHLSCVMCRVFVCHVPCDMCHVSYAPLINMQHVCHLSHVVRHAQHVSAAICMMRIMPPARRTSANEMVLGVHQRYTMSIQMCVQNWKIIVNM